MTEPASQSPVPGPGSTPAPDWDFLIIGAGLTGMHQLHRLLQRGFRVVALEAGGGIGGTWYWNRYPGARLDSESYSYQYAFDDALLDWNWSEMFVEQPELERYFNSVADRLDLRPHIRLGTRVTSAEYDESSCTWLVHIDGAEPVRTRFLITALGILSAPQYPPTPGIDDFAGESYHTGLWPDRDISFEGKRVAVIGTGASGVQIITEIAKTASQMTVFQRTPNWCIPLRNRPLSDDEMAEIRAGYPEMFEFLRNSFSGFLHSWDPQAGMQLTAEERRKRYEESWQVPGFAKWIGMYHDIALDVAANRDYCAFIEEKIRERVTDQAVADKLVPKHLFGTKRVPCESGYFEVFNQDNVELVDLHEEPIESFTPTGLRTATRDLDFDMIVFATGFDAFTGAFQRIDFRGVDGLTLREKWAEGPQTYLGMQIAGFPNLFTLAAPHNKGGNCNIPRCSEQNVEWISRFCDHIMANGIERVEAEPQAEIEWTDHVQETVANTLLPMTDSYFFGSNTPGKPRRFLGYIGALPEFTERCDRIAAEGYTGFVLTRAAATVQS